MKLEKLICEKCGEEFPATTKHGPGPAKAKFAAHVNKCKGKGCPSSDQVEALDGAVAALGTLEEAAEECTQVEVITIKEPCKCFLSDHDYKEFAIRMSDASTEITQAEDDLAAVKSQYKSRIDGAKARHNEIANIIRVGWENRPVEINLVKDYKAGEIYKVRMDTGEEISRRAMNTEERQRGLEFTEGPTE